MDALRQTCSVQKSTGDHVYRTERVLWYRTEGVLLVQELGQDPLGILRPCSKLYHGLPLSSAYAALSTATSARGADAAEISKHRRRCDSKHNEPKYLPNHVSSFFRGSYGKLHLQSSVYPVLCVTHTEDHVSL